MVFLLPVGPLESKNRGIRKAMVPAPVMCAFHVECAGRYRPFPPKASDKAQTRRTAATATTLNSSTKSNASPQQD